MSEKRLIDANDALKRLKKAEKGMKVVTMLGCKAVPMYGVIEFIETRPTVDAVEVVRCKDCRWRKGKLCYMISGCPEPVGTGDDFFCSYGERKDNG